MAVPARQMQPASVPRRRPTPAPRPAPSTRAGRRRLPFMLVALLAVASMVVAVVIAQALVAQESFRLNALTQQAEVLEEGYGELRLQAAELSAPERIAEAARQAGLVLPEEVEVIRVPGIPDATIPEGQPGTTGSLALKAVLEDEG